MPAPSKPGSRSSARRPEPGPYSLLRSAGGPTVAGYATRTG
jgi:hypothetical protein